MPNQVPVHVARERNRILREVAAKKNLEFRRRFVGKTLDVITLHNTEEESTEAVSDNYLKVRVAGQHTPNQIMKVDITGVGDEDLVAVAEKEAADSVAV
jgi:threonylcarbamoyladenosine tRNA methylthiotransferase MtaB